MIISIDLGYGYVKGINQFANISHEGNSCLFPSFVGPGHDRSIAQMVNKDQKGLDYLNTCLLYTSPLKAKYLSLVSPLFSSSTA